MGVDTDGSDQWAQPGCGQRANEQSSRDIILSKSSSVSSVISCMSRCMSRVSMFLLPTVARTTCFVLRVLSNTLRPNVIADQIAVSGHSRNGKQSLIFAAMDERVTAVVGSSPGAPIAAPYRFTTSNFYGEGKKII